jgi:hypothetical protein
MAYSKPLKACKVQNGFLSSTTQSGSAPRCKQAGPLIFPPMKIPESNILNFCVESRIAFMLTQNHCWVNTKSLLCWHKSGFVLAQVRHYRDALTKLKPHSPLTKKNAQRKGRLNISTRKQNLLFIWPRGLKWRCSRRLNHWQRKAVPSKE